MSQPAPAPPVWTSWSTEDRINYACQKLDQLIEEMAALNQDITTTGQNMVTYRDDILNQMTTDRARNNQAFTTIHGNVASILQAVTANQAAPPAVPPAAPPAAQPAAPPAGTGPKMKMAKPNKFDGSKREEADNFMVSCQLYLRILHPQATEDEKVAFIQSYLEGAAQEWVQAYLVQETLHNQAVPWLHDTTTFWQEFRNRFADVNRNENYRAALKKLKQGKTVQDYLTHFQVYATGLGYNDTTLRDMFYDGLSDNIRMIMINKGVDPTAITFAQLTAEALTIDRHISTFDPSSLHKSSSSSSQTPAKNSSTVVTSTTKTTNERYNKGDRVFMINPATGKAQRGKITDIGRNARGFTTPLVQWDGSNDKVQLPFKALSKDAKPASRPSPPADPKGPGPMDLDSAGKGKTVGVCHVCGGKGHWAKECPSKKVSGFEAKVEEVTSDEDSEKEDA